MNNIGFNFNDFISDGQKFLARMTAELLACGIPVQTLDCDHLCFRVNNSDEYQSYKKALTQHGQLLAESTVNGRLICTFLLSTAFKTGNHEVNLVELPAPKTGSDYQTGFEHLEFVISDSFQVFASQFPKLQFIESGLSTINPELCLKLKSGLRAKFHHTPLDRIIEIENQINI
jgi:predicted metalloenzyme YecM